MSEKIYNEVPYPSFSHRETHPSHLATLASLMGMEPSPVERCRVLELGCAGGGNLIAMAVGLPDSHFVGVDYSSRQIEEGQRVVEALGLQNVSLHHLSLLDIGADFGQFDYIIAHGVYSWVPDEVRDQVLAICRQNLTPNGVGYVSYNTYPGWHMLMMVREMMFYHTREITEPRQRVIEGLDFINFLSEASLSSQEGYASFLQTYLSMRKKQDAEDQEDIYSFLLHDEFSEENNPFYFHEVVAQMAAHGLQYVADADFPSMIPSQFPQAVLQKLGTMAHSQIEFEQYMDFLTSRFFRKTLLCHQDVSLNRRIQPTAQTLSAFQIAAHARPASEAPDIRGLGVEKFQGEGDAVLTSNHPVTKAAMLHLCKLAPRSIPFPALLAVALEQVYGDSLPDERTLAQDGQLLATSLLQGYSYNMRLVELRTHSPHFVMESSERPVASPFARLQAQSRSTVTNLRHERVALDGLVYYLFPYLDGTHTRAELRALLRTMVEQGAVTLAREGQTISDRAEVESMIAAGVDNALSYLAHAALLVG